MYGILDFKIHHKAAAIKMVSYLNKSIHIDPWSRIEPRNVLMHVWVYGQLIVGKGGKNIH
jgi:hypothetical protein